MITEEIKSINSTQKELRKFGISVGVVLILIGFLFQVLWENYNVYVIVGSIGAVLLFNGILFPKILLPVHKAWMTLAIVLGYIMTRVILSILFYIVVTGIALLTKIFAKDFLDLKIDRNKDSYWNKREMIEYTKDLTERQF